MEEVKEDSEGEDEEISMEMDIRVRDKIVPPHSSHKSSSIGDPPKGLDSPEIPDEPMVEFPSPK